MFSVFSLRGDRRPLSFLGNYIALFPRNLLSMRKFAMTFFGLAMTPPLPPLFGHFFQNLRQKYTVMKPTKSAMYFFGSEMTPPPFGTFPKKHPLLSRRSSLSCVSLFQVWVFYQFSPILVYQSIQIYLQVIQGYINCIHPFPKVKLY